MLLPLYDNTPKTRIKFQYVTVGIIVLCVVVFLWQQLIGEANNQRLIYGLGAIPGWIFGHGELDPGLVLVPPWATMITSMFLHASWMHLIGNMLFLWVLGDNIEDSMGHIRFVVFYILSGLAAALAHGIIEPTSGVPMIGASGAISGVIGAYLLLHPKASIHTLVFYFVIAIPAWIVLGLWIGIQVFSILQGGGGNVAWWAHIGGLVAGLVLIPFFKHKDVALLQDVTGMTGKPDQPARRLPRGITIRRIDRSSRKSSGPRNPWG